MPDDPISPTGRILEPRPLNDVETTRRDRLMTHVRGYIAALRRVVPIDEAGVGDEVRIDLTGLDRHEASIRRSVSRMVEKAEKIAAIRREDQFLRVHITGVRLHKPKRTRLPTRPWDRLASIPELALIRARRLDPDGIELPVRRKRIQNPKDRTNTTYINIYPWSDMKDGDFFHVELKKDTERERHRFEVTFTQAAARHDFEIQITKVSQTSGGEEWPMLRVTRIQGNLAALKRRLAEETGREIRVSTGRRKRVADMTRTEQNAKRAFMRLGYSSEEALQLVLAGRDKRRGVPETQAHDYLPLPRPKTDTDVKVSEPVTENRASPADLTPPPSSDTGGGGGRGEPTSAERVNVAVRGDGRAGASDRPVAPRGSIAARLAEKAAVVVQPEPDEEERFTEDVPVPSDDPDAMRASFAARRAAAMKDLGE